MKNHLIGEAIDVAKEAGEQLKKVKNLVGGVTQDRILDRVEEARALFEKYGYNKGLVNFKDFKLQKTGIPDKKTGSDTYAPEFERLRKYIIAVLNAYNPGLGEVYSSVWPSFIMANKGNIKSEPLKDLQTLLQTYPVGTYKPTFKEKATAEINSNVQSTATSTLATGLNTQAEQLKTMIEMLQPVNTIMSEGLKAAGIVPPADPVRLAETFYNEIVAKGANLMNFDNLDEPMTNAILSFIATVKAKADAGEQLNPVYQKIAGVTGKVQEKIESQARTMSGNALGNWIIDHPIESAVILIVLFLIARKLFK